MIDELEGLLTPRQIVLIGEWHGTNQLPALIAGLAGAGAAKGLAVTLGLEVPCSEQEQLDAVMADASTAIDGPFWRRPDELADGRSSQAMAALVAEAARLRGDGADVAVVAMDGPWLAPGAPIPLDQLALAELPRDEVMASKLLDAVDRRPQAVTLVLAGSEHTKVHRAKTLGGFVCSWHPGAIALLGRASGGTAWCITGRQEPGCAQPVPDDADLRVGAQWADQPGPDGYHGYVHVGSVTASPPHRP